MQYKAILFDMDGVLIDSEHVVRSSAIDALASYGIHAEHEDFIPFTGMDERHFFGGVARKHGHVYEDSMADLTYDYYGQRVKNEAYIPEGINEMLQALHNRGILLAVCSGAILRKVRYNIQALGVEESIFSAIVTGSDVENKKPAPDIYLEGAKRLGVEPKDCLVVEDAITGIEAAHAAGMDAVGIPSTFTKAELHELGKPEYILDQTKELADLPELN